MIDGTPFVFVPTSSIRLGHAVAQSLTAEVRLDTPKVRFPQISPDR
jgi:hypothetical protein